MARAPRPFFRRSTEKPTVKIAHFAPFSPNACGMYEAARDFIRADRLAGRVSELVDVGGSDGTTRRPLRCGEKDARGGFEIVARESV